MSHDWSHEQMDVCRRYKCEYVESLPNSKLGIALKSLGQLPINGLRHPSTEVTCGWFIWCGEEFSEAPDFFSSLHVAHLDEICPEVIKFLGLPAGYRFLIAGDYVDAWYDASLLNI